MSAVVDFHVHVFPDYLKGVKKGRESLSRKKVEGFRKQVRSWLKPLTHSLHAAQTVMRHFPDQIRNPLDEIGALLPLPGLLVESNPNDLKETMKSLHVDQALVIAHPPVISNEFVLELCQEEPSLLAAVNIPKRTPRPGAVLKGYVQRGARALKIHPSADGEGPDSPRYRALLRSALELGLPVIIHTGCIHSHLAYKKPDQANAELYSDWFKNYPELRFILAHMNFHAPQVALDLCERFPNLYVDTSWQPAETIGEAVRRIGADRVLFGSDWPLLGDNMAVARKRVEESREIGLLNPDQAQLILGENAVKLLGLKADAFH